uniref:Ribosomal protein L34 n=1 Tax=Bostrychia moritziana TaxID=103713 RepID=A0A1Z1M6N6_BOSMO|nr:ribosomal protein L34 [Bostrychia moritziana]ARW61562.1 ribosomal protein L34 [Bostrychia moritziana]
MKTGSKLKRIKKSGFLSRMKTSSGKKIIQNKRNKKRKKLNIK